MVCFELVYWKFVTYKQWPWPLCLASREAPLFKSSRSRCSSTTMLQRWCIRKANFCHEKQPKFIFFFI